MISQGVFGNLGVDLIHTPSSVQAYLRTLVGIRTFPAHRFLFRRKFRLRALRRMHRKPVSSVARSDLALLQVSGQLSSAPLDTFRAERAI